MEETVADKHVIIHGHFYQPPRENPWTERIDRQDSAAPYHDWNERISVECYRPNSCSRRLDGFGRITKLVNNYEYISFNFGPTLFSWIEEKEPDLYVKIIEADRMSSERLDGHGNAIAQAFNHLIMPLASPRDQETQIKWGLYDFERRFGREPEGIWLPETAINGTTLEILIDFGFRFIILSPHQAERVRPLKGGARWKDVSNGSISTGFAYRCFGPKKKGRYSRKSFIDIFFYDAPLSTDISFNHLLRNGDGFAAAVMAGFERGGSDLVVMATDGEIYGHHEPFADMALSYFADHAAPSRDLHLTNFGAYLDRHEPVHEVQLKSGPNGEGTAWSCSHGVGRWKENCGCNTGAPPGHTQKWRSPLRRGLDGLRDGLVDLFESEGAKLLAKPWDARNDYIGVVEHRTTDEMAELIKHHSPRELSAAERARALSLLESQRNAMLMFTSCGWFFNDITGIETVQLLKYAARAIELAGPGHSEKLEKEFLATLKEAKSNTSEYLSGTDLYQNARKRSAVDTRFLAAQHAIFCYLFDLSSAQKIFRHCISIADEVTNSFKTETVQLRTIQILSPYTLETSNCCYLLVADNNADITVYIGLEDVCNDWESNRDRFAPLIQEGKKKELIDLALAIFDEHPFTLRNLFPEDRERALNVIAARQIEELEGRFRELFEQNKNLLRLMHEAAIEAPACFLMPAQTLLSNDLVKQLGSWERSLNIAALDGIKSVVSEANRYGVPIDRKEAAEIFSNLFLEKVRQLRTGLDAGLAHSLFEFVKLSSELGITINEHETQNEIYEILMKQVEAAIDSLADKIDPDPEETRACIDAFLELARRFNFNTDSWQERLNES
jgi:alpha-amylase/alpha-mannosidase (GH57 family)